jgi:SAM-dependent methyltransferase
MMKTAEAPGYLLAGSDVELDRLQLQARVWEPAAEAMLAEIGVRPGWRVLDLAPGAMGIVRPLSKAVGDGGCVVALDNDPALLGALARWVEAEGFANVEMVEDDAFATGLPDASFDLVHVRFLFAPVGRDDELMAELLRLVKPGGVIAIQEPDAASWDAYPESAAFAELKALILAAFRAGGGDFDAGRRMGAMLRAVGCADVRMRAHQQVLGAGHPYRRLPVQFAASLRPRILAGGLVDEERLDALVAECERIAADDAVWMTTFTVKQAWGRAPHRPTNPR